MDSPAPRPGVVELLGVLSYLELRAFSELATGAELAPTMRERARMAKHAATEYAHYERLVARLESFGQDPFEAMHGFVPAIEDFHRRTAPSTWLEVLVKAYVGDGIAQDFYREVAAYVDAPTRELVTMVTESQNDELVPIVRGAIAADSTVGGRLALWGRRLVGEALTAAQRVVADNEGLGSVLVGGPQGSGADLAELGRMFARLTEAHTVRMGRLGLSA